MNRSRYVGSLLWVVCLVLTLLSGQVAIFGSNEYLREAELQKIQESLGKFQEAQTAGAFEAQYMASIHQNLSAIREGALLVDSQWLLSLSLLALIALGLVTLLLSSAKSTPIEARATDSQGQLLKPAAPAAEAGELLQLYEDNIQETVEELQRASLDLNQLSHAQFQSQSAAPSNLAAQFDEVIRLQARLTGLQSEVSYTLNTIKDVADHLQSLSKQCDENAQFTAATRLEWNAMGSKLRLMRDNQNKLKSTAEKLSKQQLGSSEMISQSLNFGNIHDKHAVDARVQIQKMNEISKETLSTLDILAQSMAESNQDVGDASSLVRGLSERAEEIVNIIDVIDDIAEQTNQLALNASIEAARAGEQGQGFAVVAGEVRNLAARSSTATKSITDLLGTIQQEADHASGCLEKTRKSVGTAHTKMLEVDRSYRDAVHLSRQALIELNQLISTSNEHMLELKNLEKHTHEMKKYCKGVLNQLDEQDRLSVAACNDSNQLTQHTDRLSRLLNRQYFEISHCDRMVEGTYRNLGNIKLGIEEGLGQSEGLRGSFQLMYQHSLLHQQQSHRHDSKYGRLFATLQACSKNLELIKASPQKIRQDQEDRETADPLSPQSTASGLDTLIGGDVLVGDPSFPQKAS